MNSKELKMIKESIDSYIESISTEDLVKELNKRKATELPKLIEEINAKVDLVKSLAEDICHETEAYRLVKLEQISDGSVIFVEEEC